MRSPAPTYGGKYYMMKYIIDYFPDHYVYVSGCGGGTQDLFYKEPSLIEVYNDLNERVVNFFRVLRDKKLSEELRFRLTLTPFSREEFNLAKKNPDEGDLVERALRFYVQLKQSYNYSMDSWNCVTTAHRGGMAKPVCSYLSEIDIHLPKATERLRSVEIENMDVSELLLNKKYNRNDVFVYIDPPYTPDSRVAKDVYEKEMDLKNYLKLLNNCMESDCKIMISGYDDEAYDILKDWRKVSIGKFPKRSKRVKLNEKKSVGEEILWMNYDYETDKWNKNNTINKFFSVK